jgi:hypothetical protein
MRFRSKIYLAHTDRNPSVESIVSDKRTSKRSMIENTPHKGTNLSDFIRTFAILDSVSVKNLFFCNTETSDFLTRQNFE